MRIDVDERTGISADDLRDGDAALDWQAVFENPDQATSFILPWISHELPTRDGADTLAARMVLMYPDRPVWVIGLDPDAPDGPVRIILHLPDAEGFELPDDGKTNAAVSRARERSEYLRAAAERRRAKFAVTEAAKVPPVPAAGPDLDDQLYSGKVIPIPGTPAADRAAHKSDGQGGELAELRSADGHRLASTPRPGEGGVP